MDVSFSIVVPVYNAEKTLERVIRSILHQSFKNYELILIDDCSTDGSYQIAQKYADMYSHIRLLQIESNSGSPKVPREKGVAEAKGDYIINIDSDDIINEDYIERMYDILSSQSDIDVVIPLTMKIDYKSGRMITQLPSTSFDMSAVLSGYEACRMTILQWTFSCGGMAAKKDLYEYAGKKNPYKYMNSDELTSRLILHRARKVAFSPQSEYTYYSYPTSITHKSTVKLYETLYTDTHLIAFAEKYYDQSLVAAMCARMLSNMICLYKDYWKAQDFTTEERRKIEKIFVETFESLKLKRSYLPALKYQLYLSNWLIFTKICAVMAIKKRAK